MDKGKHVLLIVYKKDSLEGKEKTAALFIYLNVINTLIQHSQTNGYENNDIWYDIWIIYNDTWNNVRQFLGRYHI